MNIKKLMTFGFVVNFMFLMAQGSQNAIDFGANAANKNHLNLGMLPLGTSDFSIQFWLKSETTNGDPSIFSNKNWSSGNNTGINLCIQGGGNDLDINFKGATGARKDLNLVSPLLSSQWNHITITADRDGALIVYLNGVQKGTVDISASTGSIEGTLPFILGQDGTGVYGGQFTGQIDELRIWTKVLTLSELRQNMCKKILGNESGLLRAYNFDLVNTTQVQDFSTNAQNATASALINANFVSSNAAIGDESVFAYNPAVGSTLTLNSVNGNVVNEVLAGAAQGVQFYKINALPSSLQGISELESNQTYFGVFLVEPNVLSYKVAYDYSVFGDAVNNENNLLLFGRTGNEVAVWNEIPAVNIDLTQNILDFTKSENQEFILGFVASTCADVTNVLTQNIGMNNAQISWTSPNAIGWDVQYGSTGFTLGQGTIQNTSVTNLNLNGLNPSTSYEYYIKANCAGAISSNWFGPIQFSTLFAPQASFNGPAMAANLDGQNEWIDVSNGKKSAASLNLPNDKITIECWVNPERFQKWNGLVTFVQDNGSFERGWTLETRDNDKFGFGVATSGVMRYVETNTQFRKNQWYHVAATYDGTSQKLYINGKLEAQGTASSGLIDYVDTWLAVGSYKDNDEQNGLLGKVDEVRIWNVIRTEAELRANMCRKLNGNETGLLTYLKFDELSGAAIVDVTGNFNNGTLNANRVISGAPIGDTSTFVYGASDWSNQSLVLASANNGNVTLNILKGNLHGVHLYRVNSYPDVPTEFVLNANTNTYYGVFVAEADHAAYTSFDVKYMYNNFPSALTNEQDLVLLNRLSNDIAVWGKTFASLNTTGDFIQSNEFYYRKEVVLAKIASNLCSLPFDLSADANDLTSATAFWTNGGSGKSNIQWGEFGFSLGQGAVVHNITVDSNAFNNLNADLFYEFYVQDSCAGGNSVWVGPYFFSGRKCLNPNNVSVADTTSESFTITWDNDLGNTWVISWGNPGFNPDWGVQDTKNTNIHTISGLAAQTDYEFYIKTDCGFASTSWVGPFKVTTKEINTANLNEINNTMNMQIYPNPFNDLVNFKSEVPMSELSIFNMDGKMIYKQGFNEVFETSVDLSSFQNGIYTVRVNNQVGMKNFIIIKN